MIGLLYSGLVSLAVAMLAFLLQNTIKENKVLKAEKEKNEKQRKDALENGVVCLLRAQLIEYHSKYTEAKHISSHGYENWIQMYRAYKQLGGNGMIDHMEQDIEELKIEN